jgi:hypothetical protein
LAREQEKRARLAEDAWVILRPELERNKQLAIDIQSELPKGTVDTREFYVSAWETISKGGLLLGLNATDVRNLLSVYNACYRANETNASLNDFASGLRATLPNRQDSMVFLRASLLTTLGELEQAMNQIDSKK